MREHPIPQDITGYKFHIVGSMTLKQFGELALGVVTAGVFWQTNLVFFIKWPLIVISIMAGVIAAFIPIGERPLDHWILTFFKVLYKPTQYFWKRKSNIPDPFLYEASQATKDYVPELDLSPMRRERIKEFLITTELGVPAPDALTRAERVRLQNIAQLFDIQPLLADADVKKQKESNKPKLKAHPRRLRSYTPENEKHLVPDQGSTDANVASDLSSYEKKFKSTFLSTDQVAQNIVVPKQKSVKVTEDISAEDQAIYSQRKQTSGDRAFVANQEKPEAVTADETAQFNTELPFPSKPSAPNKLVGMVLSPQNELITDAIVEIKNKKGQILRAVKTNALGQFFVTTPLANGDFIVTVEKDGYSFSPQNISLTGKIVDPIEVRSST